jgi:tetratricopeptide (TPR) repeat protein
LDAEKNEEYTRLQKICAEWLPLDPDDDEVHRLSAVANLETYVYGKEEETLAHLNKAVELNVRNADAYFYRAKFGLRSRKLTSESALSDLNSAIELRPNDSEFRYLRGVVNYAFERYEDARKDFDVFIFANPHHARGRRLRGGVLRKLGENSAADLDERCANILDGSYRRKGLRIGTFVSIVSIVFVLGATLILPTLVSALCLIIGFITLSYGIIVLGWSIPRTYGYHGSYESLLFVDSKDIWEYSFEDFPVFLKRLMPPAWLLEGTDASIEAGKV